MASPLYDEQGYSGAIQPFKVVKHPLLYDPHKASVPKVAGASLQFLAAQLFVLSNSHPANQSIQFWVDSDVIAFTHDLASHFVPVE